MKENVEDTLRDFSLAIAERNEQEIVRQLGSLIVQHEDCKRFFKDRFFVKVMREQLTLIEPLRWQSTSKFLLSYHSPSFFKRLKFFVFDIVTWLKEREEGK